MDSHYTTTIADVERRAHRRRKIRMDHTTQKVREMYAKFPYPSPQARSRKLKELANLFKIFAAETRFDFAGKQVLDAGTGTGHRLIEAARTLKETRFLAVDICEPALQIAQDTAAREGVHNIEFRFANLLADGAPLGKFDIVVSMGVVHHLSDPASGVRKLAANLKDDGLLFLYVYGHHGSRERMRRKQIVSHFMHQNPHDFDTGIKLVKELGFDTFEYGWNLNFDDEASRDALIVDAYLNVNESLYQMDSLLKLMKSSGLEKMMVYGVALEHQGSLFDTRLAPSSRLPFPTTDISAKLASDWARQQYDRLPLREKYNVIDLMFQPAAYTVLAFNSPALRHLSGSSRIAQNTLTVLEQSAPAQGS